VAPCNQVGCGLSVTIDGTVLGCPGNDIDVLGYVPDQPIETIWFNSANYRLRRGTYNCGCPAKIGKSIPVRLFERVMQNLEAG
jgi:MoaA/NifB/PqqE/SkfB family radical SAM enzyme